MRKRLGEPEEIKEILRRVLKRKGLERRIAETLVVQLWPEVVGAGIASHTQALYLRDGILFGVCDSSVWNNELNFLKIEIIRRLNQRVNKRVVEDIRLRVGRIKKS